MCEKIKVNTLPGFENVLDTYYVDKFGNVFSNEIEMKTALNTSGYYYIKLKEKNKRHWKMAFCHRLVALAFVDGRTNELNEVDHIDGNKKNNCYYNLRWTDRKGNMQNPITMQKMKDGIKSRIKCYVYDYRLNFVGAFDSIADTQNYLGIKCIKHANVRIAEYYILSEPDLSLVLDINRKQRIRSIVITDIYTHEKYYFHCTSSAANFFENKVNITDAIQKNWTVRGRYKIRALNYKKLIDMLDL